MNKLLNFLWPVLFLITLFFLRQFLQNPNRSAGAHLYRQHCQNCHMEEGQGLQKLIPPLQSSSYLVDFSTTIPCLIRNGIQGPMVVNGIRYDHPMPANPQLSDEDIYQLMRFMYGQWVDPVQEIKRDFIRTSLEDCK